MTVGVGMYLGGRLAWYFRRLGRHFSSCCSTNGTMLVFMQKTTFSRKKSTRTVATRTAFWARICTKSFVVWDFSQTLLAVRELTAVRKCRSTVRPLAGSEDPCRRFGKEERDGID